MEQTILQFLVTQGPMGVFSAFIFFLYDRSYKAAIQREQQYLAQAVEDRRILIDTLTEFSLEFEKLRNEITRTRSGS